MSGDEVDIRKRRFLTAAATVVGGVGAAYAAVPFLASWLPSERAKAAGAPVQADISKLESGQMIRVQWRGKPVWVVKRTEEMLAALPG
ncbi:MAG: ubiquinol-cytochrome c reductase iron-sulfur subunit, partial [Gammaproteobacteria bacterium]